MKSPIQRRHQKDKRLFPLRGEGNQVKHYQLSNETIKIIDDARKEINKIVYGSAF